MQVPGVPHVLVGVAMLGEQVSIQDFWLTGDALDPLVERRLGANSNYCSLHSSGNPMGSCHIASSLSSTNCQAI